MNHQPSKFRLCCLPTQYGKTFVAARKVNEHLAEDSSLGKSLHIVITMDNLLNNSQTAIRFSSSLESRVAVLSSKKMGKQFIHTSKLSKLKDLLDSSSDGHVPQVVITCNNRYRMPQILDLVSWVQEKDSFRRVFLYFDELHKYIHTARGVIEQLCIIEGVKEIVGLSATPYAIWCDTVKKNNNSMWDSIQMLSLPGNYDSLSPDYMGVRHTDFYCVTHEEVPHYSEGENPGQNSGQKEGENSGQKEGENSGQKEGENPGEKEGDDDTCVVDYIHHVLTETPEILCHRAVVFAPANITCYSHIFVRRMILDMCPQAIIVLLNGGEKTVTFQSGSSIDSRKTIRLPGSLEISEGICSILRTNDIDRDRPIIITGCLCLGMGQTLINKELGRFTSAILGKTDTINDDMYQLYGRITGRSDDPSNPVTEVYTTKEMQETCIMMESMATNLMIEFNGIIATRDDYLQPMLAEDSYMLSNITRIMKKKIKKAKKDPLDKGSHVFETQEEAIAFAKVHFERPFQFQKRKTDKAPKQYLKHGENPTEERIMKNLPGINAKTPVLMVPIFQGKWLIFWRPSLIHTANNGKEDMVHEDVYRNEHLDSFENSNPMLNQ